MEQVMKSKIFSAAILCVSSLICLNSTFAQSPTPTGYLQLPSTASFPAGTTGSIALRWGLNDPYDPQGCIWVWKDAGSPNPDTWAYMECENPNSNIYTLTFPFVQQNTTYHFAVARLLPDYSTNIAPCIELDFICSAPSGADYTCHAYPTSSFSGPVAAGACSKQPGWN